MNLNKFILLINFLDHNFDVRSTQFEEEDEKDDSFKINEMSISLFGKMFNYLDFKDQMNCRSVNHQWKDKIDEYLKNKWLVIFDRHLVHDEWFEKSVFLLEFHSLISI